MITASPALLARERKALARSTEALAELLAAETGAPADDLQAEVAANALMGVHRALIDHVRRRVLSNDDPARLAADVRGLGEQAFALLEHGLGDYATKPPGAGQARHRPRRRGRMMLAAPSAWRVPPGPAGARPRPAGGSGSRYHRSNRACRPCAAIAGTGQRSWGRRV